MGNLIDQIKTLPDPRNNNVLANCKCKLLRNINDILFNIPNMVKDTGLRNHN